MSGVISPAACRTPGSPARTFEGRSYLGRHRHVTLTGLAQASCTRLRHHPKPCAGLIRYAAMSELQALLDMGSTDSESVGQSPDVSGHLARRAVRQPPDH